MRELKPNPITGFLESINPTTNEGFTSDKKVKFLELATEFAKRHEYPDIVSLCDSVGTKYRTFTSHLEMDEVFREAWNDVKARLFTGFTQELSVKAKSKGGIVANLAILKYLESGTWIDNQRVIVSTDNTSIKGISGDAKGIIEGEIIDNPRLISSPDQMHEK